MPSKKPFVSTDNLPAFDDASMSNSQLPSSRNADGEAFESSRRHRTGSISMNGTGSFNRRPSQAPLPKALPLNPGQDKTLSDSWIQMLASDAVDTSANVEAASPENYLLTSPEILRRLLVTLQVPLVLLQLAESDVKRMALDSFLGKVINGKENALGERQVPGRMTFHDMRALLSRLRGSYVSAKRKAEMPELAVANPLIGHNDRGDGSQPQSGRRSSGGWHALRGPRASGFFSRKHEDFTGAQQAATRSKSLRGRSKSQAAANMAARALPVESHGHGYGEQDSPYDDLDNDPELWWGLVPGQAPDTGRAELLDAFVAVGGRPDGTGTVPVAAISALLGGMAVDVDAVMDGSGPDDRLSFTDLSSMLGSVVDTVGDSSQTHTPVTSTFPSSRGSFREGGSPVRREEHDDGDVGLGGGGGGGGDRMQERQAQSDYQVDQTGKFVLAPWLQQRSTRATGPARKVHENPEEVVSRYRNFMLPHIYGANPRPNAVSDTTVPSPTQAEKIAAEAGGGSAALARRTVPSKLEATGKFSTMSGKPSTGGPPGHRAGLPYAFTPEPASFGVSRGAGGGGGASPPRSVSPAGTMSGSYSTGMFGSGRSPSPTNAGGAMNMSGGGFGGASDQNGSGYYGAGGAGLRQEATIGRSALRTGPHRSGPQRTGRLVNILSPRRK